MGRRCDEVMVGKPNHLGKIGKGVLPSVVLPVGVCSEAHRGVEGEIGAQGAESLGIQGQRVLHAKDYVSEEQSREAERQQ